MASHYHTPFASDTVPLPFLRIKILLGPHYLLNYFFFKHLAYFCYHERVFLTKCPRQFNAKSRGNEQETPALKQTKAFAYPLVAEKGMVQNLRRKPSRNQGKLSPLHTKKTVNLNPFQQSAQIIFVNFQNTFFLELKHCLYSKSEKKDFMFVFNRKLFKLISSKNKAT